MKILNATTVRRNFFDILDNTIQYNQPVHITTKRGNAVLISEDDYTGFLETMHLLSSPQTKKEIMDGINTPLEECVDESEVNWNV